MDLLEKIEKRHLKQEAMTFHIGDTIKVFFKIKEGDKTREQPFEGVVLKVKSGLHRSCFTLRKVSYGVAVEKTFPFHSPLLSKIEIKRFGKVRRAKLYYLRERSGKAARIKEKRYKQ